MPRYLSPTPHYQGGPDRADPFNPTKIVFWATADTPELLERIYKEARKVTKVVPSSGGKKVHRELYNPKLAAGVRSQLNAKTSSEYRTRQNAVMVVDESVLEDAKYILDLVEVPQPYFEVIAAAVKLKYFTQLWEHESKSYSALPYNRPTLEQLTKFLTKKLRHKVIQLLVGTHYVDDPKTFTENPDLQDALTRINKRMQQVDLGRQSHLQFSSTPGKRRMFGKHAKPIDSSWLINPLVVEWQHATTGGRAELHQKNPTLEYMLQQAGLTE